MNDGRANGTQVGGPGDPPLAGSKGQLRLPPLPLTPGQSRALDALLAHETQREAATAANVSERSLRRWLSQATFKAELARRGREALAMATLRLKRGALASARSLCAMAEGEVEASGARVAAARAVVELSIRAAEIEDVAGRLDELEDLIRQAHGRRRAAA